MYPSQFDRATEFALFEDFAANTVGAAPALWQTVKGTGGTVALEATGGTWIDLPTAASANDYILIAPQQPILAAVVGKHINFEVQFKCTEAATNASVLAFGLSNVLTTGFMQNTTAGPAASFTGAVFYKVSGGLALGFRSSAATVNTDNAAFATLVSGTTYRLGIEVNLTDATTAIVTPKINGQLSLTTTTGQVIPKTVQQSFAYGTALLYPFVAVKAGSSSAETLSIDWIGVTQVR